MYLLKLIFKVPNFFSIVFPSEKMKKVEDMEGLANFYAKMMTHFVELMGTGKMQRQERVVFDVQIAAGRIL